MIEFFTWWFVFFCGAVIVALGIIFVWGGLFYPIDRFNDGVLQITWACIWIAFSWNFIWGTGFDIFERSFQVIGEAHQPHSTLLVGVSLLLWRKVRADVKGYEELLLNGLLVAFFFFGPVGALMELIGFESCEGQYCDGARGRW